MLGIQDITRQSLDLAAKAAMADQLGKAITVGTGLVGYNLQAPALQLVALQAPFQKTIPRVVKPGANSDNWRVISALAPSKPFTAEAAAANPFTTTLASKSASFGVIGVLGQVTLEAQRASIGFDDALAKETANALLLGMKLESQAFMGATYTALGNPSAPLSVAVQSSPAGSLAPSATTYYVRIVALNILAANRVKVDVPGLFTSSNSLLAGRSVTRANFNPLVASDGSTPVTASSGITAISAETNSGSQTGTSQSLKIIWSAVPGAVAYAVFVGTTTGAANLRCECIVGQTNVTLTSLAGTGVLGNDASVPSSDQTADTNGYDGIVPQLIASGSGAYVKSLGGTMTGALANGEVVELQDAFANIFQAAKIGKFRIVVSGTESRSLTKLGVISNAMQIFTTPGGDGRPIMTIGAHVGEIVNGTTGDRCPIDVDPWLPPGTILILPTEIPYPQANVAAPFTWVGSYDWQRWDYSSTTSTGPVYPFEVRNNGVLEGQFTAGCGVIYNIFNT